MERIALIREQLGKIENRKEYSSQIQSGTDPDIPETEGMSSEEIVEVAMEHCEKAEKLVSEGKILSAMREEKICTIVLARAAGAP